MPNLPGAGIVPSFTTQSGQQTSATIDGSTIIAGGVLDLTSVSSSITEVILTNVGANIRIDAITGGTIGQEIKIIFNSDGSKINIFGKKRIDAGPTGIVLANSSYAYLEGYADVYQSDYIVLRKTSTYWIEEMSGYVLTREARKVSVVDSELTLNNADEVHSFYVLNGGTNGVQSNTNPDRMGVITSTANTTATSRAGRGGIVGVNVVAIGSLPTVVEMDVMLNGGVSDGTTTYTTYTGLFDLFTGNPTNSIRVTHNSSSPNWLIITTIAGPLATVVDTGIPVIMGQIKNILIVCYSNIVYFYMGTSKFSHQYAGSITTNIPTSAGVWGTNIIKSLGAGIRSIQSDYIYIHKVVDR